MRGFTFFIVILCYLIIHFIIMCRVNMEGTEIIGKENYYVTAREEDIRPYGILYKKIQ